MCVYGVEYRVYKFVESIVLCFLVVIVVFFGFEFVC